MKANEAVEISKKAKDNYIKENIDSMIKKIDAVIVEQASRSSKFPVMSCSITIEGEFDISGVLEDPIKEHYRSNGFGFTINSSRSNSWMSISWSK